MPKKRGPKTDVLEALLKRVDGLEAKLKEKKEQELPSTPTLESVPTIIDETSSTATGNSSNADSKLKLPQLDTAHAADLAESAVYSPPPIRCVKLKLQLPDRQCRL